jgi:hypothetical protein
MSIKTTIANLGRVAAMFAFGGAFVAQGVQTGSLEGRTNPEVKTIAETVVRQDADQGLRKATMDQQWLDVCLEWEHFNGPVADQNPNLYRLPAWSNTGPYSPLPIPGDWPLPPGDLVMAYGRFKIRTVPDLPGVDVDIKCPALDLTGYTGYLNHDILTGVWTFCVPPDYPYRFPFGPGNWLYFEVTINHPDLWGQENRVILRESVL